MDRGISAAPKSNQEKLPMASRRRNSSYDNRRANRESGYSDYSDYSSYSRYSDPDAYRAASRASSGRHARSTYGESEQDYESGRNVNGGRGSRRSGRRYEQRSGTGTAYSRNATQSPYQAKSKKRRRKKVALTIVVAFLCVLVAAGGALAYYMHTIDSNLNSGVDSSLDGALTEADELNEPFYILLMGTDGSAERQAEDGEDATYRSDSMILCRVDPTTPRVTMVSIVRDTYVNIPGYGMNKINAAHALGGASLTVQTVSEFAGVPIAHYVEIDFDGFEAAVDALGGIDVDVPIEIDDEDAGGHLDAGYQHLNGEQALILCRARHAYDEYGSGDFYRAANQRMVMGAVAKKLLSSDVATMASTISAMSEYVTTDMTTSEIISIAVACKDLNTDTDIYSTMNPTISTYENETWYEYSNDEAWQVMMERVDAGESPTVDESDSANDGGQVDGTIDMTYLAESVLSSDSSSVDGTITVQNGCGTTGLAASVTSSLTSEGYTVEATEDADSYDYAKTLVIYNSSDMATGAATIAESLGVGTVEANDGSYDFSTDYLVIIGADYSSS
jgi:LCP family protein required for cell wall assembly